MDKIRFKCYPSIFAYKYFHLFVIIFLKDLKLHNELYSLIKSLYFHKLIVFQKFGTYPFSISRSVLCIFILTVKFYVQNFVFR